MILASLMAMILLVGCASGPPTVSRADQALRTGQADTALREARAEADALRADIANARIVAAKQEAELRDLRRRVQELQVSLQAKHAELAAVQNERDRLAQSATVAQVHVAGPATVPVTEEEWTALKVKLRNMETTLAVLQEELARVKQAMGPSPQPSPSMGGEDGR